MAYLMTHFWPGATEEQYATTLATMHPARGAELSRRRRGGWRHPHLCGVGVQGARRPLPPGEAHPEHADRGRLFRPARAAHGRHHGSHHRLEACRFACSRVETAGKLVNMAKPKP